MSELTEDPTGGCRSGRDNLQIVIESVHKYAMTKSLDDTYWAKFTYIVFEQLELTRDPAFRLSLACPMPVGRLNQLRRNHDERQLIRSQRIWSRLWEEEVRAWQELGWGIIVGAEVSKRVVKMDQNLWGAYTGGIGEDRWGVR